MLFEPAGSVVAPVSVRPADWLAALHERRPLVLAPGGESGWFGGTTLIAVDPDEVHTAPVESALHAAGVALDESMRSGRPALTVALLPYDGDAVWATYPRGLIRAEDGWRTWGEWRACEPLAVPEEVLIPDGPLVTEVVSDMDARGFMSAVHALQERILAGDVYVLNLTRRLNGHAAVSAAALFESLLRSSGASMAAAWLSSGERALLSASPERFATVRDGVATIAPVKGTRPRGADPGEDTAFAAELASSPKERAEHVMIVDLERNDLGRVCEPGSVRADTLLSIETTAYCHQMVSLVSGRLRPGAGASDLLAAIFPCGSVTGAPKYAAIRIASELEASPRGAYTGSMVVTVPGWLDSSVLIRTVELDADRFTYGTGCGVTIDSDPHEEWVESVLKTRPLLGTVPSIALRETCRLVRGRVPLWRYHRARLARGGCGVEVLARADAEVVRAAEGWDGPDSTRLRLTCVVAPEGSVTATVERRLSSLDVPGGPRTAFVDVEDAPVLPPGAAKPADRSYWDAAQRGARKLGGDIAVLVAPDGAVLDGGTSTIWLVEGDTLVTPPAPPAVAGVARAFLLESLARAGVPARVEPVTRERFEGAEDVFLTNAFGGFAAVRDRGGSDVARWTRETFARLWAG